MSDRLDCADSAKGLHYGRSAGSMGASGAGAGMGTYLDRYAERVRTRAREAADEAPQWLARHREAMAVCFLEVFYQEMAGLLDAILVLHRGVQKCREEATPEARAMERRIVPPLTDTARIWADEIVPLLERQHAETHAADYETDIDLPRLRRYADYIEETILPDLAGEFEGVRQGLRPERIERSLREAREGKARDVGDAPGR